MTTTPEDFEVTTEDVAGAEQAAVAVATRKQVRKEQRQLLLRSPSFIIGAIIIGFWLLAGIWPELLDRFDPKANVPGVSPRSGPGDGTWWGTDRLGRDVYSRVVHGARPILIAAPAATIIAAFFGTLLGLFTGYFRGWVDEVISRILEAILSIPAILLAIVIVFTFGATTPVIIGTIGFLFIPAIARTVRAATLAEAQLDYVTAAQMRGERSLFIIWREIFPNIIGVVIVEVTVRLGYAIFTLATLAFLGLSGGNATDPNWGLDVAQNYQQVVAEVWWPTVFPALAIGTLVIGVNLLADSIDEALKS
ncbi:MAG: ABC transporter permease [Acidimicrobiia bacterium]|nr:ABC transporter permease [Acidimicrobiia bacterium]